MVHHVDKCLEEVVGGTVNTVRQMFRVGGVHPCQVDKCLEEVVWCTHVYKCLEEVVWCTHVDKCLESVVHPCRQMFGYDVVTM